MLPEHLGEFELRVEFWALRLLFEGESKSFLVMSTFGVMGWAFYPKIPISGELTFMEYLCWIEAYLDLNSHRRSPISSILIPLSFFSFFSLLSPAVQFESPEFLSLATPAL